MSEYDSIGDRFVSLSRDNAFKASLWTGPDGYLRDGKRDGLVRSKTPPPISIKPKKRTMKKKLALSVMVGLLVLAGCKTSPPTYTIVPPPMPPGVTLKVQPSVKRTMTKAVSAAPFVPPTPKPMVLKWDVERDYYSFANGYSWSVEYKEQLAGPWTVLCVTNYPAVTVPLALTKKPQMFWRVGRIVQ